MAAPHPGGPIEQDVVTPPPADSLHRADTAPVRGVRWFGVLAWVGVLAGFALAVLASFLPWCAGASPMSAWQAGGRFQLAGWLGTYGAALDAPVDALAVAARRGP
jgi:hypothetical protein